MKKILLLCSPEKEEQITSQLCEAADLRIRTAEGNDVLSSLWAETDVDAVLIDEPSSHPQTDRVIDHVRRHNNYIFAIPIFFLSSPDSLEADAVYLGGPAVDVILKPVQPAVLRNRLERGIEMMNSVSFSEFAKMLKVLPANIYLKDALGRYVFSSQTWHHLDTGGDPNWTIRGKTDLEIRRDKENAALAEASDRELIRTGKGISYIIEENEDGIQEFLQLIKEPLRDSEGRVQGIIALINNVTEQERMRRELERVSVTDSLTGLRNRASFEDQVKRLASDADSFPLSIFALDCDGLKGINDHYGHQTGDQYILMAADLMRSVFPEEAFLFRTGGDEFTVLLPRADEDRARALRRELRIQAERMRFGGIRLEISIGAVTVPEQTDDLTHDLKQADDDMYADKKERKQARQS